MDKEQSCFEQLLGIDVKGHIEKKGKFSYLSWAWSVQELRKAVPKATWEVIRFDGKPFLFTECGYFVEVAVTVDNITLSQIHPVLDNYNKPIAKPNAFQINTSIQRALVKAIALHGLGLHIYAGEDLVEENGKEKKPVVINQNPVKPIPAKPKKYRNFDFLKEMKIIKERLNKATGKDEKYYEILGQAGYVKSNEIPPDKQIAALKYFNDLTADQEKVKNVTG